jgi:diguanylate cyclase
MIGTKVMEYNDSIEDARGYFRFAIEQIGKHGSPVDPLNYCIWYEYASGKNKPLNEAIDSHLGNPGAFKNGFIKELYNEFIANEKEKMNDMVRDGLRNVFSEIIGSIQTTTKQYTTSNNNLQTINDSFSPESTVPEMQMVFHQLRNEIKSLESTNSAFQKKLDDSSNEIKELKSKLELYREESIKDPLTRIDNRRGFDQNLQDLISRSNDESTSLCLIMADIDHFKKINDTHGHLVGDNVLRMVAGTIKESVKGKDLIARIGGEEFAIILPNTPLPGAIKLAEDMRKVFENYDLKKKNTGESLGKVTLSFGVGNYKKGESLELFLNRVDEALYQSKKKGRNRVTAV